MSKHDPILVKAANEEFNRWANFLFRRPYTTHVVAEFVDEIEDAFAKIRDHPDRYPRWKVIPTTADLVPLPSTILRSSTPFGMG
ncbi:MAG: hypothetical protein LV479_00905 [Methylacidiphilales bacterium]|nr:hypothetical protein [Candidatus Methylacidiphilales bacterium]